MFEKLFVLGFFFGGFASAFCASVLLVKKGRAPRDWLLVLIGIWGAIVSGLFGFISAGQLERMLL